jgi:hypothetical protein
MHTPCTRCAACLQEHTSDKHCVGWFWNFANASARDYFVSHLVAPLAEAPSIDGVFFDAVNYGYDIPEVIEYSPGKYSEAVQSTTMDTKWMGGWMGGWWVGGWALRGARYQSTIHPSTHRPYLSEVRPWGMPVLNVPNCSTPVAQGGAVGWGGCEALLNGTLDVLRRTTQLLNSRGKVRHLVTPLQPLSSLAPP